MQCFFRYPRGLLLLFCLLFLAPIFVSGKEAAFGTTLVQSPAQSAAMSAQGHDPSTTRGERYFFVAKRGSDPVAQALKAARNQTGRGAFVQRAGQKKRLSSADPVSQALEQARQEAGLRKNPSKSKTYPKPKKGREEKKAMPERKEESLERRLPPLRSIITSYYGERRPGGSNGFRIHGGVDIRAHLGWPVVAFRQGVVTKAGRFGNAGLMVELEHDKGLHSRYAHLRSIAVAQGDLVAQGDVVGEVGCTGYSTGAHLHFSLSYPNTGTVDPLKYLVSADEILRPRSDQIPKQLGPQQCNGHLNPYTPASANIAKGPVIRGRHGRPIRVDLEALRRYKPPEIPLWQSRVQRAKRRLKMQ